MPDARHPAGGIRVRVRVRAKVRVKRDDATGRVALEAQHVRELVDSLDIRHLAALADQHQAICLPLENLTTAGHRLNRSQLQPSRKGHHSLRSEPSALVHLHQLEPNSSSQTSHSSHKTFSNAKNVLEKKFPRVVRTLRSIGKFRRRVSNTAFPRKEDFPPSEEITPLASPKVTIPESPKDYLEDPQMPAYKLGELYWLPHESHVFVPALCSYAGERSIGKSPEFVAQWPVKRPQLMKWNSVTRVEQSSQWRYDLEHGHWLVNRLEPFLRQRALDPVDPSCLPRMREAESLEQIDPINRQTVLHKLRLDAARRDFNANGSALRLHQSVVLSLKPEKQMLKDDASIEENLNFEKSVWLNINTLCVSVTWKLPASIYQPMLVALAEIIDSNAAQSIIYIGQRGYDEVIAGISRLGNALDFLQAYLMRHFPTSYMNQVTSRPFKVLHHRRLQTQTRRFPRTSLDESKRASMSNSDKLDALRTRSGLTRRFSLKPDASAETQKIANRIFDRKSSALPQMPSSLLRNCTSRDSQPNSLLTHARRTLSSTAGAPFILPTLRQKLHLPTMGRSFKFTSMASSRKHKPMPATQWITKEFDLALPSRLIDRIIAAEFVLRSFTSCSSPTQGWVSCAFRGIKLNFGDNLTLNAGRILDVVLDTTCLSEFVDVKLRHQRAIDSTAIDFSKCPRPFHIDSASDASSSVSRSTAEDDLQPTFKSDEPLWPFHIFFQLLEGHDTFLPESISMSLKFRKCDPAMFDLFQPSLMAIKRFRESEEDSVCDSSHTHVYSNEFDPHTTQLAVLLKDAADLGGLVETSPLRSTTDPDTHMTELSARWLKVKEMQREIQLHERSLVQDARKTETPTARVARQLLTQTEPRDALPPEKKKKSGQDPSKAAFFRTLLVDHRLNAKRTMRSLSEHFGFSNLEMESVFGVLAAVLHFSNVQFAFFAPLDCYLVADSASLDSETKEKRDSPVGRNESLRAFVSLGGKRLDKRISKLTNDDFLKLAAAEHKALVLRPLSVDASDSAGGDSGSLSPTMSHLIKTFPCPVSPSAAAHAVLTAGVLKIPVTVLLSLFSRELASALWKNTGITKSTDYVYALQHHANLYEDDNAITSTVSMDVKVVHVGGDSSSSLSVDTQILPAWVSKFDWLSTEEGRLMRKNFMSLLYRRLVTWLVNRINDCLITETAVAQCLSPDISPLKQVEVDLRKSLFLIDGPEFRGYKKVSSSLEELVAQLAEERLHQIYLAKSYRDPLLTLQLEGMIKHENFVDIIDLAEHPSAADLLTSPNLGSLPRILIRLALYRDRPAQESIESQSRSYFSRTSSEHSLPFSSSTTSTETMKTGPARELGNLIMDHARSRYVMPSRRFGTEGFITKTFFGYTDYKTTGWIDKFDRHLTRVLELIGRSSRSPIIKSIFEQVDSGISGALLVGAPSMTYDIDEEMKNNPLAACFTDATKLLQALDSTNAHFVVNMTVPFRSDGTPDSVKIFQQAERFELTRISSLLRSVPLCSMPIQVFLRRYFVLARHCYRKTAEKSGESLPTLVISEDEEFKTRVTGTSTAKIALVKTWLLIFKSFKYVDYEPFEMNVTASEVRMASHILSRLDAIWSKLLMARVTALQAAIRGRSTRRIVRKLKAAREAHAALQSGFQKAKQQNWNYFQPSVFTDISSGEEFLAKVHSFLELCEECEPFAKTFMSGPEIDALRVFNAQILEHASLLCECERMLCRQETQLQPINSLLSQISSEGLQGDAISMLILRAQKLKTEEQWRRKILRALKRNDVQAAAATLEQIRIHRVTGSMLARRVSHSDLSQNPTDIISPHLNHLVSEFQRRSPNLDASVLSVQGEVDGTQKKTNNIGRSKSLLSGSSPLNRSPLKRLLAPTKRIAADDRLDRYVTGYIRDGQFKMKHMPLAPSRRLKQTIHAEFPEYESFNDGPQFTAKSV